MSGCDFETLIARALAVTVQLAGGTILPLEPSVDRSEGARSLAPSSPAPARLTGPVKLHLELAHGLARDGVNDTAAQRPEG